MLVSSEECVCVEGCNIDCDGPGGTGGIRLLLKVMNVCCSDETGDSFGGGSEGYGSRVGIWLNGDGQDRVATVKPKSDVPLAGGLLHFKVSSSKPNCSHSSSYCLQIYFLNLKKIQTNQFLTFKKMDFLLRNENLKSPTNKNAKIQKNITHEIITQKVRQKGETRLKTSCSYIFRVDSPSSSRIISWKKGST